MKRWIIIWIALFLVGCTGAAAGLQDSPALSTQPPASQPTATPATPQAKLDQEVAQDVPLDNYGPAPELTNQVWLNSPKPLRLADLRGKVVLLDMWTFGCINCQHVVPSLKAWYTKYSSQGLVVIGNHYPEFDYEKELDLLQQAVRQMGIRYPVAQDNDGNTWRAYNNRYWPTLYLIDKHGDIRYVHIGEGRYPETEAAIQALLAEAYP
jgi:thiol-disulfide isomerase/thioredoxin